MGTSSHCPGCRGAVSVIATMHSRVVWHLKTCFKWGYNWELVGMSGGLHTPIPVSHSHATWPLPTWTLFMCLGNMPWTALRHLAGLKWTFMHGMDYSHRLSINWPIVWNSLTRSSNRKANYSTTLLIIVNCNDWSFTFLLSIHFHQAKENILKVKAGRCPMPSLTDDTLGLIRRAALSCYKLIFPLVWFHHAFMRWWLCCLDKEILYYN